MTTADNTSQAAPIQPPQTFSANANVAGIAAYQALCAKAEEDYEGFWADLAREHLTWSRPFSKVLDEDNAPFATCF